MKIFISGGCKNGKSSHAQRLAKKMQRGRPLYYLATMTPKDAEDEARILAHQKEREGCGFETVEVPSGLLGALSKCDPRGVFLLDSVTALLENGMFLPDGSVDTGAHIKLCNDLISAIMGLRTIVIVSDYIYSDGIVYFDLVEGYKKNLAYIDRRLAAVCDVVIESCFGGVVIHKSNAQFRRLHDAI